jgi:hypothetical protein
MASAREGRATYVFETEVEEDFASFSSVALASSSPENFAPELTARVRLSRA